MMGSVKKDNNLPHHADSRGYYTNMSCLLCGGGVKIAWREKALGKAFGGRFKPGQEKKTAAHMQGINVLSVNTQEELLDVQGLLPVYIVVRCFCWGFSWF